MLLTLPFLGLCLWLLGLSFYLIDAEGLEWARWLSLVAYGSFFAFIALGMGHAPNVVNA